MKQLRRFQILVFAFGLLSPVAASALGLEDAFQSAFDHSHELKQLQLVSESLSWDQTKARAGYLPHLDLAARHLFSEKFQILELEFNGADVAMPAIQPYSSLAVDASLEVFSGFQTSNEVEAARLAFEASEHNVKRAEDGLRAGVRTLFYKALGSQILVTVAQQNIETLERHWKDVSARVRSGVSTRFDLLRTEVQLEDARTEKVAAEDNVAMARARLFEAIGTPDDHQALGGKLPEDFGRYEGSRLNLQEASRQDRIAQVLQVEAGLKRAQAAKAHWYPHVSVFGSQEWYNNTNHSMWQSDQRFKSDYALGVQMKWNLFDGGAAVASQRQAALASQVANEKLARFDLAAPVDLEEAQRRLKYHILNYKTKQSSIRKAEEAVRLAEGGVRAGTRTNMEALDAVVDLNRAKAASVKSQVEAIEALGQLELAIGHQI